MIAKRILLALVVCLSSLAGAANNVYLAPSAAGANDGTSCANAKLYTYFNSAGNWSATPSGIQIGPDTTVHACTGTYTGTSGATGLLVFQGSGTSGHVVTLVLDPGATFTAPYWGGTLGSGTGVIQANGLSYLKLDGSSNASLITASANGTGLTNTQATGIGVSFTNVSNSRITGMNITNIYVHLVSPDDPNKGTDTNYAINWYGGSNVTIDHNQFHDVGSAVWYGYPGSTTSSNVEISFNVGYNTNHTYTVGDGSGNAILNGANLIHDNEAYNFANWDDAENTSHHDGIFPFTNASTSTITGLQIYNNYIHGDPGFNSTAAIFVDGIGAGGLSIFSPQIINNVIINNSSTHQWGNGMIDLWSVQTALVEHNVVAGTVNTIGNAFELVDTVSTATLKNNIFSTVLEAIYLNQVGSVATQISGDHNVIYNWNAGSGDIARINSGASYTTIAAWRTACSCDAATVITNPLLSGTYAPTLGSSAIGQAIPLASPAIATTDKAGVARQTTGSCTVGVAGCDDAGAYQYIAVTPPPVTPAAAILARVQ